MARLIFSIIAAIIGVILLFTFPWFCLGLLAFWILLNTIFSMFGD